MYASTTAASASQKNRRTALFREEEEMTHYTTEELENDWEFKIVRSYGMNTFRKPENLRRLIEEEALAGWVMVEKFDDTRVRFKRPMSARKKDYLLEPDIDPYRSIFGMSAERMGILIAVSVILLVSVILAVVFAIVFSTSSVQ